MQVVDFLTRTANSNGMLIDTIFLDTMKYDKISVKPFVNGLSDHNTQIICLRNINTALQKNDFRRRIWVTDEKTINKFLTLLKDGSWDSTYNTGNVNEMFNNFQCTLLRYR